MTWAARGSLGRTMLAGTWRCTGEIDPVDFDPVDFDPVDFDPVDLACERYVLTQDPERHQLCVYPFKRQVSLQDRCSTSRPVESPGCLSACWGRGTPSHSSGARWAQAGRSAQPSRAAPLCQP